MKNNYRYFPRIFTLELHQDDPAKCTSAKMRKFGLAVGITPNKVSEGAIMLNPFAETALLGIDVERLKRFGLVVIDCSWVCADRVFKRKYKGVQRRLPVLVAGNPTNYAKIWSLSSVEAAAAALYILKLPEAALRLINIYKWGNTFLTLNKEALDDYSNAKDESELRSLERDYFPQAFLKA